MPAANYSKLIKLLQTIRTTLGAEFMITYTIIPNQNSIDAFGADNWQQVAAVVDYINLMGYDYFGSWERSTGLQSALYTIANSGGSSTYSDDTAIQHLNSNKVPSSKIILGVPAYGRAVPQVSGDGLGQSFSGVYNGNLDGTECGNDCSGTISYEAILANGYTMHDVTDSNGIIIGTYSNFTQANYGNVFVSYDSPNSIKAKIDYIKNKQLPGIMLWDLNYDAPAVNADGSENNQAILNVIDQAFNISPRPTPTPTPTGPYFILQVSNTGSASGTNPYASATLVVNGGYYPFATASNQPIVPGNHQQWGTLASASNPSTPGVVNSSTLDSFFSNGNTSFTTSQILINAYSSPNKPLGENQHQFVCPQGNNFKFEAGHSYNLMINSVFGSCTISQIN